MIRKHTVELSIIAALFVLTLGFFTNRYIEALRFAQEKKEELILGELQAQSDQIAKAQLAIDILVDENKTVGVRIKEETEKRLAAEAARQTEAIRSQQKIAELEQNISKATSPDLAAIIKQWRPSIAAVKCEWVRPGTTATSRGSGVLFLSSGVPTLITNRHVVLAGGGLPDQCKINFPGDSNSYIAAASAIRYSQSEDFAKIDFTAANAYVQNLATAAGKRCTGPVTTGDSIIILGYPSIGSQTDVTATEGIISGYDSPHYITSAKVERGNSGGAAILAKENCYLGIPTFVDVGQIEALARILNQQVVSF